MQSLAEDDTHAGSREDDEDARVGNGRSQLVVGFGKLETFDVCDVTILAFDLLAHVEVAVRPHQDHGDQNPGGSSADDAPEVITDHLPDDHHGSQLADRRIDEVVDSDAQLFADAGDDLAETFTEHGPFLSHLDRGCRFFDHALAFGLLLGLENLSSSGRVEVIEVNGDLGGATLSQSARGEHGQNQTENQRQLFHWIYSLIGYPVCRFRWVI